MEDAQERADLWPASHSKAHDAHPYLRTFPRGAFCIVVVPDVAKGGARDLCCMNRGCREGVGFTTSTIVQSGGAPDSSAPPP